MRGTTTEDEVDGPQPRAGQRDGCTPVTARLVTDGVTGTNTREVVEAAASGGVEVVRIPRTYSFPFIRPGYDHDPLVEVEGYATMAYPCRAWARGLWISELAPRAHARWVPHNSNNQRKPIALAQTRVGGGNLGGNARHDKAVLLLRQLDRAARSGSQLANPGAEFHHLAGPTAVDCDGGTPSCEPGRRLRSSRSTAMHPTSTIPHRHILAGGAATGPGPAGWHRLGRDLGA